MEKKFYPLNPFSQSIGLIHQFQNVRLFHPAMEAMEAVGFTSMDCYPAVNIQAKMFASVSQELGFPLLIGT